MKKPTSATRGKSGRKSREELNQEARDRKRQKKHRALHAAGSRANGGDAASAGKKQRQAQDPRVGSKNRSRWA